MCEGGGAGECKQSSVIEQRFRIRLKMVVVLQRLHAHKVRGTLQISIPEHFQEKRFKHWLLDKPAFPWACQLMYWSNNWFNKQCASGSFFTRHWASLRLHEKYWTCMFFSKYAGVCAALLNLFLFSGTKQMSEANRGSRRRWGFG